MGETAWQEADRHYRETVEHVPCGWCDGDRPVTVEYERDLPCTRCNLLLLALFFRTLYRRYNSDLPAAIGAYYGVPE